MRAVDQSERNRTIYELRRQGATYTALGRQFGLCPGRARAICEEIRQRQLLPPLGRMLSGRALWALKRRFWDDNDNNAIFADPARIVAETSRCDLMRCRNCGPKTTAEIAGALEALGYHLPDAPLRQGLWLT